MKAFLTMGLLAIGCSNEDESTLPDTHAVPLSEVPIQGTPTPITPWLQNHFDSPVPPQGDPPETFGELESGTQPENCQSCHPTQYEDWKTSWHAMGMGPGIMGQLIDLDGTDDAQVAQCQRCHAPLSEQAPRTRVSVWDASLGWEDNPHFDAARRTKGLTCTGCHVRQHERFGPGNDPKVVAADELIRKGQPVDAIHNGARIKEEYKSPAFCRTCHDFDDKPRIGVGFEDSGNSDVGVLLSKVTADGAGEAAGLQVGDRILSIQDEAVITGQDLKDVVELAGPNRDLTLRVARGDETLRLDIQARATRSRPHGKLLQETTEEWQRTRYAAEGVTCQNCHMPEGRHLWKGIHDKDMVASGLSSTASVIGTVDGEGVWSWITNEQRVLAELTATNVGAGHRLPTYTTPEIHLIMQQMDRDGALIEGTQQETIIARRMTPNLSEEVFDTRLLLGESLTLHYDQERHTEAQFLRAWIEVWPDETYRRNYEAWLKHDQFPNGRTLLEAAHQASIDSRYELWRKDLSL